jgi:hypothetical protein
MALLIVEIGVILVAAIGLFALIQPSASTPTVFPMRTLTQ